jgi:hypothetical protein
MRLSKFYAVGAATLFAIAVTAGPVAADDGDHKVTICHGSASQYVLITIDVHALPTHLDGHGFQNFPDKFPVDGSCDGVPNV